LQKVFEKCEVIRFISNGLRKSAISYYLAAHPQVGIGQVADWTGNSESSARQYYVKLLTKEQGEAWFNEAGNLAKSYRWIDLEQV
jgi:hypothetical protein